MHRFVVAVGLMFAAVAAVASEPMAVRVTVYQRMPQLVDGDAVAVLSPDTILPAPQGGWPASYDAVRRVLSPRRSGKFEVMVAEIIEAKPMQADQGAAFFIPEISHAIEVRAAGNDADLLIPGAKRITLPMVAGTTVLGAKDEQVYLAVTFLPVSAVKEDAFVIVNGARPLRIVSRMEPNYPRLEAWRNRSGNVIAQLRIEPDGSVSSVDVLLKGEPRIDAAAVEALKQWRFEPPTRNGQPAAAYMVFSAPFHIE